MAFSTPYRLRRSGQAPRSRPSAGPQWSARHVHCATERDRRGPVGRRLSLSIQSGFTSSSLEDPSFELSAEDVAGIDRCACCVADSGEFRGASPARNADGTWSVSNTFIVCAVVLAVCLLFSTIALAMSKKKIKTQAFTARISTSGVATTSIYDIPVEPAQRVSGATHDSLPRPNPKEC